MDPLSFLTLSHLQSNLSVFEQLLLTWNMSSPDLQPVYDPTHLFPVPFVKGFTTCTEGDLPNAALSHIPLSSIKPTKGKKEKTVVAPHSEGTSNTAAWQAFYPKGSINPSGAIKGGFGFYLGSLPAVQWEEAKEIVFSYAVYFEPGFDFQLRVLVTGFASQYSILSCLCFLSFDAFLDSVCVQAWWETSWAL